MPTIPTSTDFDLFDWSSESDTDIVGTGPDDGLLANSSVTQRAIGSPHSYNVADAVVLSSGDGVLTDLVVSPAIVEDYTLEFELKGSSLPLDLENPGVSRVFLAASDGQGAAAGVLLSKAGIAIVAQPGNSVLPFSQSAPLIPGPDDYLTVRLTYKHASGTLDIYLTKSADLATTGHVLRYTVQAPASESGLDKAHVEVLQASIVLREFRLSSVAQEPHKRPVASAGSDQTVPLGGIVSLKGEDSLDPEGGVLTYKWTMAIKPDNSLAQLTGAVAAFKEHSVAGEGVKYLAKTAGKGGNSLTVEVVDPGGAGQLKVELSGNDVKITLAHDGAQTTTSFQQVHQLLTNPGAAGYDADVALLMSAELVGDGLGQATALAKVSLAGGEDSSSKNPTFSPDKAGTYQFQLVVNDGTLDSLPATVLVVVQDAAMHLGHIPDAEFLWSGLSDFWTLVPDKAPITTFWSTALQLVAGEMLKAWQDDYAKSLRDIPRLYIRKWGRYSPFLDDGGDPTHVFGRDDRIVVPATEFAGSAGDSLEDGDGDLTTPNFEDQGLASTVDLSDLDFNIVNLLVDTSTGKVREIAGSLDAKTLVLRDELPVYDLIDSGDGTGRAKNDGDGDLHTNLWSSTGVFKSEVIQTGDILRLTSDNDRQSLHATGAGDREAVFASLLKGTLGHSVSVELKTGTTANVTVSVGVGDFVSITFDTAQGHTPGDVRTAVQAHPIADKLVDVRFGDGDGTDALQAGDAFGRTALAGISTIGGGGSPIQSKQLTFLPGKENPAATEGPHREVPTDLRAVSWEVIRPAAKFAWKIPAYVKSSLDLEVDELVAKGDQVRFEVVDLSTGEASEVHCEVLGSLKTRVAFNSTNLLAAIGGGFATALTNDDGQVVLDAQDNHQPAYRYSYKGVVRLSKLPVHEDIRSVPRLVWPIKDPTTSLDENADYSTGSKSIAFDAGLFASDKMPPDDLWGEVTYYDNSQVIENNFGSRAGLLKEDAGSLDYLSAVQALWYASLGGPKISNLHLGSQVFLGLSFAEAEGKITSINDLYTETHGQIIVADAADPDILRAYLYPRKAGIGINPDPPDVTDSAGVVTSPAPRAYQVGDTVAQFAPLTSGVTVDDYIKTPRWFVSHYRQGLLTEVEKFFTFRVQWNTKVGSLSADSVDLAARFLQKMRPVYTSPMLMALHEITDQVSIAEDLSLKAQIRVVDNPRGAPNEPNNPKDSIGHPAPVVFDSYDGAGRPELQADDTSPRSDVTVNGGDTSQLDLATPLPTYHDGTCPYLTHHSWVVLLGPRSSVMPGLPPVLFANAGVYRLLAGSTASALKLGEFAAPHDPVALPAGAVGIAFTLRDTPADLQTLLDADPQSPVGLLFLDKGVWEPKAVFDGGIVPYFHTVNRAVRIDMDHKIDGVAQKGPRFDQGLVFDDLLGDGKPNVQDRGGAGLFWWFDGGDGAQEFYTDYAADGQGYDRPSVTNNVAAGVVSRVTGHDGQSLPTASPDLFVDPLP